MALTLGYSDYAMFDGAQTVTFTHVTPPTNSTASITNAVGMGQVRREVATAGGFVYQVEQEWWLPVAELAGIAPAEGDFLTDAAGVNWWLQSDIEYNAQGIAGIGGMYRVMSRIMRTAGSGAPAGGGVSGTFGGP